MFPQYPPVGSVSRWNIRRTMSPPSSEIQHPGQGPAREGLVLLGRGSRGRTSMSSLSSPRACWTCASCEPSLRNTQPHGVRAVHRGPRGREGLLTSEGVDRAQHEVMLVYDATRFLPAGRHGQPLTYSLASLAVTLAAHFSRVDVVRAICLQFGVMNLRGTHDLRDQGPPGSCPAWRGLAGLHGASVPSYSASLQEQVRSPHHEDSGKV